jgi:site-specific DNA-methyltransferase (cytosine-N4-specific)
MTQLAGDARVELARLKPRTVQVCVTSPPYYRLRDYGDSRQIGLESTVDEYVQQLRVVFRHVLRALTPTGTLWLNLGDTYNAYQGNRGRSRSISNRADEHRAHSPRGLIDRTAKNKDLLGVPWRVVLGLTEDGWYRRSDVIWPRNRPERVKDRPRQA